MELEEYCNLGGDSIKRPIVVIAIGYIIGIIWGLYFNFSIVLLYIIIAFIYGVKKNLFKKTRKHFKLISINRYFRYIKLFLTKQVTIGIIVSSIFSNVIFLFQENKYTNLYPEKNIEVIGIVISNKKEKEFKNQYKVKVLTVDNSIKYKSTQIYIDVKKEVEFQYGDKLFLKGEFKKGRKQRNTGGFDYQLYLKSINIYGTLNVEKYQKLSSNNMTILEKVINNIKIAINQKIEGSLEKEQQQIVKGLLLGDTTMLEESLQEKFQIANISHVLAVSGMHVVYIVIGIDMLLKKYLGKRNVKYITIFGVLMYISITGASSSIVRAGVMGILNLLSFLVYRKKDIWTSIAISLLFILIQNPYSITRSRLTIIIFGNNWYNCISKKYKALFG